MKGALLVSLLLCSLPLFVTGQATWPNGPVKSIYIDWQGIDNGIVQAVKGAVDAQYNLVILAFLVSKVEWDAAKEWANLTYADRASTIAYVHSKNARLIVTTGGSTDTAFYQFTPRDYGEYAAVFSNVNLLDGVDFDLENFAGNFTIGTLTTDETIQWVADATNAARLVLGPNGLITHAPQPPYFGENNGWKNAYTQIYQKAPSIDYLQVQFYNNGNDSTFEEIFTNNKGMSVLEISQLGIPLNKIVVGKPVQNGDGSQVLTGTQIHDLFVQAAKPVSEGGIGWNTGVMGWTWHGLPSDATWIQQIYPSA
eukprot:Phypoly_transcript_13533.p1 GENE.Phypoly_transcript_13533~~Phypoly_transcript_13533.p1  ORF type:complete len:310 (+),score=65.63 Phypoly_transcript_13533:96-1025(+)